MPTKGYFQDHSGTLAAGTSQTLIADSIVAGRSYFRFQNLGTHVMWLDFAKGPGTGQPTAVASQPSIKVQIAGSAGDTIVFEHGVPQGGVSVIGTAADTFTCKTIGG